MAGVVERIALVHAIGAEKPVTELAHSKSGRESLAIGRNGLR